MSLTNCLKKLGKNISAADRAAIQQLAGEHRKGGKSNSEAAMAAVRGHMAALEAEHATLTAAGAKPKEAPAAAGEGAAEASVARAASEAAALDPDMLVQLEGMDAPMRVGELLDAVKKEAADDVKLGKLVEIAAACDLRS